MCVCVCVSMSVQYLAVYFREGEDTSRVSARSGPELLLLLLLLPVNQPFSLPSLSLSLSSPFVTSSLSLARDPYYASLLDFIIREMSRARAGINSRAQASRPT